MDSKPIVTCHGDQAVFSQLRPAIVHGLPRESVEWKRSYGRPRRINIEAIFVPFNPDILPDDNDWSLPGRPFLHTYWLECDLDGYKSTFKEEIAEWVCALKAKNIFDWLIIVVVNSENKVKTKILRTSVFDKVKNDFCSKQTERCIILAEPFKSDTRGTESWASLFARLRQLFLVSYDRNMGAFEEHMRAERERRTEKGWNFCNYFLLQEELALMYEMLHLYEDALIQYDELDALFTQYVLNHVAGDTAAWLHSFISEQTETWDGISLDQPINVAKRNLIKKARASLLDFRNYLFSRQTALMFLLHRSWEVAERSIPFMQNCMQELLLLKVEMPPGATAAWVFISSLEILYACDRKTSPSNKEAVNRHAAGLWDYARLKLHEIAEECGLLSEGSDSDQDTKKAVQVVVEGATERIDKWSTENKDSEHTDPITKMVEGLSSKEAFQKHYLELSELAMGTYKFIGRIRSARMIGQDLAAFYMKQGLWQKAEGFLQDALKIFKQDGWDILADHTALQIAECQRQLSNHKKLVKSCAHIAGSCYLPEDTRQAMFEEMMGLAEQFIDEPVYIRSEPALWIVDVKPESNSVIINDDCCILLKVHSNLPSAITCNHITVSAILDPNHEPPPVVGNAAEKSKSYRRRHSSETSLSGIELYNHLKHSIAANCPQLDFYEQFDMKADNKTISACGIAHREREGHGLSLGPRTYKDKDVVKEDDEFSLRLDNVQVSPGDNQVRLSGKLSEKGYYSLSQVCIKVQGVEFLKSVLSEEAGFSVICDNILVSLAPSSNPVLAGFQQAFLITVRAGSFGIQEGSELILAAPEHLSLDGESLNEGTITLPVCAPYEEVNLDLNVCCHLNEENSRKTSIEHQITIECPQHCYQIQEELKFQNPFKITEAIHSCGQKSFIQVIVHAATDGKFYFCGPSLEIGGDSQDVQVVSANKPDQQLLIAPRQCGSYIWQLADLTPHKPDLQCKFEVHFSISETLESSRTLAMKFELKR